MKLSYYCKGPIPEEGKGDSNKSGKGKSDVSGGNGRYKIPDFSVSSLAQFKNAICSFIVGKKDNCNSSSSILYLQTTLSQR